MKSLLEIIGRSERFLRERGIERPRREAEEVIANVLGIHRIDLYLQFEKPLSATELEQLRTAIVRRANHEPAAYISGKVAFAGLTLKVTPAVLIPRPETEILVEKISEKLQTLPLEGKVLWDLCCGSGCLGHALKKRFPALNIVLSDISEEALEVARQNGEGVTFKRGDLFAPFKGERCDFLVCNPPYVTEEEYSTLSPEVKREPKSALVGGVAFYKRIAADVSHFLNPGGMIWLEMGTGQGDEIKKIFHDKGVVENDWAGHTRFFFLEID